VNSKRTAICQGTLIIIGMVMCAILLNGCGGDAGSCDYGGARGYVYQSTTGCVTIISASPTPPAGYEPVPAGTVVRIQGYPDIHTTTDASGFYYLPQIPAGLQVLVVEAPCGEIIQDLPIIPGRITEGGGHQEGGGGIG
jgi:hypothetical protein